MIGERELQIGKKDKTVTTTNIEGKNIIAYKPPCNCVFEASLFSAESPYAKSDPIDFPMPWAKKSRKASPVDCSFFCVIILMMDAATM